MLKVPQCAPTMNASWSLIYWHIKTPREELKAMFIKWIFFFCFSRYLAGLTMTTQLTGDAMENWRRTTEQLYRIYPHISWLLHHKPTSCKRILFRYKVQRKRFGCGLKCDITLCNLARLKRRIWHFDLLKPTNCLELFVIVLVSVPLDLRVKFAAQPQGFYCSYM